MARLKDNNTLNKIAIDLVTQLTELKQKKYYRDNEERESQYKIKELENAIKELNIPLPGDWSPYSDEPDYGDDYGDDY